MQLSPYTTYLSENWYSLLIHTFQGKPRGMGYNQVNCIFIWVSNNIAELFI